MQGTVYKSTGSWYIVKDETGKTWNARIKGRLKIDGTISSTNPIAVGDKVSMEIEDEEAGTTIIDAVADRHNYIVRVSPHNRHQKHIVASNLDLALIMATVTEPRTSLGFIDRFLITAEAYHIPVVIIVNKTDLLKPKHETILERWKEVYASAGYKVLPVAALKKEGIDSLKELLENKTTLFSGHSGVGRTLINLLMPDLKLKTLEVSGWSGKGQHTTTFAEMFDLPFGGKIIDTPGVKEFGLIDIKKEELSHYFPEIRIRLNDCKFNNCLHYNEPGCAVKEAVNDEEISEERYISYLTILDSIEEQWK